MARYRLRGNAHAAPHMTVTYDRGRTSMSARNPGRSGRLMRHYKDAERKPSSQYFQGKVDGHRSKLLAILRDPEIGGIVVEHRDRLAGFGAEYIEASFAASGRRLIVMEQGEVEDDLVRDMTEVLTFFCARLYGRRSARHRAKRALEAAKA